MERTQVNVRLSAELVEAIDRRRIELQATLKSIPTRSEIVRLALDEYLLGSKSVGQQKSSKRTEGQVPQKSRDLEK